MEKNRRDLILSRWADATDPAERRRLLNEWLAAGGRDAIDQAVEAGLETLKTDGDIGD